MVLRIEEEPVATTIGRLVTYVKRMEARYECPSETMVAAIEAGYMKNTAEIGRWLASYRTLCRLKECAAGHAAGTATTTIS